MCYLKQLAIEALWKKLKKSLWKCYTYGVEILFVCFRLGCVHSQLKNWALQKPQNYILPLVIT